VENKDCEPHHERHRSRKKKKKTKTKGKRGERGPEGSSLGKSQWDNGGKTTQPQPHAAPPRSEGGMKVQGKSKPKAESNKTKLALKESIRQG